MAKKPLPTVEITLDRIIGGGQTIGTLDNGKKCLVWGGLPGEVVTVQLTKKKSSFVEGYVTEVKTPSPERIEARELGSFLST
ncbi:MAG: TRAM domain-containing protein, partial [Candidatus Saccharibacteria bacterium]|nr:TRAM domain-containing protein [Candidatus Saccharibacteria bacterium]